MKTILITGGAGFIGSHLVKRLWREHPDYKIVVIDALTYAGNLDNIPDNIKNDSRFEFWYGDVRNADLVNSLVARSDVVYHLAANSHIARSIYDNYDFFDVDVLGTQTVANAVLKNHNVERLIHISTSEVFGTALKIPMDEEHPLNPLTPYASAKAGADRLVYSYYKTYDIPAIILRSFNVYGPNQHLEKVIPRFITSASQDKPLTIHGTGEYTRDWNYVDDTCEALDRAMHVDLKTVKGEVINIGTGIDTPIISIAHEILAQMDKPESLITYMGGRPGQVDRHISSTKKSKELLGWHHKTDLYSGLGKTIEWYKMNKRVIK